MVLVANICLFFYPLYVQDLLKAEDDFWLVLGLASICFIVLFAIFKSYYVRNF